MKNEDKIDFAINRLQAIQKWLNSVKFDLGEKIYEITDLPIIDDEIRILLEKLDIL